MKKSNPKAGKWKPKGSEVYEVSHLYTEDALNNLEADLGVPPVRQKTFRTQLFNIAGILNAGLHSKARPRNVQKRSAIKKITSAATDLVNALAALDPDSEKLFEEAAGKDTDWKKDQGYDDPLFDGDIAWRRAKKTVQALKHWSDNMPELAGKAGRPADDEIYGACDRLHQLWKDYSSAEPTKKPFVIFLRKALEPVLAHNEKDCDFQFFASQILHSGRPGN